MLPSVTCSYFWITPAERLCLFELDVAVYRLKAMVEISYDSRLITMHTY